MQILEFGPDVTHEVSDYGSEGFTVTPMTRADGAFVAFVRLASGGLIGRHPTVNSQLLMLVDGDAMVSGEDGVEVSLAPGQAALWKRGEVHSTRTVGGMSAVVTEGRLDLIRERRRSGSVRG